MGKVITWDKHQEERENCVFIRGHFYHKTRDCHFHNGIYYSPFSRYYVLDHETGQKVFNLDGKLKYGIIRINDDGTMVFGYFTPNILKNCEVVVSQAESMKILPEIAISRNPQNNYVDIMSRISTSFDIVKECGITPGVTTLFCRNAWEMLEKGYVPVKSSDSMVLPKDLKACKINPSLISAVNPYSFNLAYNSETMMDLFAQAYGESRKTVGVTDMKIAEILGNITFGIEYESWDGRIPTYIAAQNGLIPLRDGSLRHDNICGYEYATVIMSGANGVAAIKSQCAALKEFTFFNEKCSMHIHIGNIPRTPENLVNIWKGLYSIQDDLFTLFPSCLKNTASYKQKDYCNMLPKLDEISAESIVQFLSSSKDHFEKFGKKHPLDPSNTSKWNVPSRYGFCNLNNFYYTGRGTVELRISTPTFNHNKVTALLLLFSLILREAISGRFYKRVSEIVAMIPDPKINKWVKTYVDYRRETLSGFTMRDNNVEYYENFSRDEQTGNSTELY